MIKLVNDTIDRADINALVEWLQQDPIPRLTKGELTVELEEKWAKKMGTKYSVFVNSGSSAILLLLAALKEIRGFKNNNIVVPALSWLTDVSSPMLLGMNPILCDANDEDLSCDLNHLEKLFKEQEVSALLLVSVLGLCPDMEAITQLCKKYDVILLEDNCESMGSKVNGKYLGTWGLASVFSMYYGHHLSVTPETPIPHINEFGKFTIAPIKEIYENYVGHPETIQVLTFDENNEVVYQKPKTIIKHVNFEDILEVTLEHNRKINITKSHSVFTVNDENEIIPKAGFNLKVGDYLAVPKRIPSPKEVAHISLYEEFSKTSKKFFVINHSPNDLNRIECGYKSKLAKQKSNWKTRNVLPTEYVTLVTEDLKIALKNSPKAKYIPSNIKITPELCRLLGYYIAEGSYTDGGLQFSFHKDETDYIDDIVEILKNTFQQDARTKISGNSNLLNIDNKTIKYLFKHVFNISDNSKTKRIPSIIWHSSELCKTNFLYGYFCGDSTKDGDRISVASANLDLINDVSYICSMLGIQGSISKTTKANDELYIKGIKTKSGGVWSFRIYNCELTKDGFNIKNQLKSSGLRIKHSDRFSEVCGDITLLEVKKIDVIKDLDTDVYDFSVDYTENFIGGIQPICLHNSTIEGGFINTNDTKLYHALLMMRSHGWDRDLPEKRQKELRDGFNVSEFDGLYTFYMPGMNVRSTDLQAFLGLRAIDKLDAYAETRYKNFTLYNNLIETNELNLFQEPWDYTSNFAYPMVNKNRDAIVAELKANDIECRPLIAGNMANNPFWKSKYDVPSLPMCERIDKYGFYLPNHQDLTTDDIKLISNIVNSNL
jgi:dTDP-4-amino-4,6-dideoxygalactose transaminase/intein/homing endonuclease